MSCLFFSNLIFTNSPIPSETIKFDTGDTAWMIVATALVLLMTPGLGFFYGGMVHRKNVISTMMKSVVAAGVVSVLWVFVGYLGWRRLFLGR